MESISIWRAPSNAENGVCVGGGGWGGGVGLGKKVSKVVGRRLQDKWQCWCREGWEEKKFFFKCHHLVFLLLVSENRTMTITSTKNVKIEPINTTRAWNEEQRKKIWLSDRNQTLDLPNTGQVWFLSGTQMFSLFHARVMLITSLFTFHYRA